MDHLFSTDDIHRNANRKAEQKEIDDWKKRSEETQKAVDKAYDEVQKALEDAQKNLENTFTLTSKGQDASGKDRLILNDINKAKKDL